MGAGVSGCFGRERLVDSSDSLLYRGNFGNGCCDPCAQRLSAATRGHSAPSEALALGYRGPRPLDAPPSLPPAAPASAAVSVTLGQVSFGNGRLDVTSAGLILVLLGERTTPPTRRSSHRVHVYLSQGHSGMLPLPSGYPQSLHAMRAWRAVTVQGNPEVTGNPVAPLHVTVDVLPVTAGPVFSAT